MFIHYRMQAFTHTYYGLKRGMYYSVTYCMCSASRAPHPYQPIYTLLHPPSDKINVSLSKLQIAFPRSLPTLHLRLVGFSTAVVTTTTTDAICENWIPVVQFVQAMGLESFIVEVRGARYTSGLWCTWKHLVFHGRPHTSALFLRPDKQWVYHIHYLDLHFTATVPWLLLHSVHSVCATGIKWHSTTWREEGQW